MAIISCCYHSSFFFFNDTATTEIYTLSLHDALPICARIRAGERGVRARDAPPARRSRRDRVAAVLRVLRRRDFALLWTRSEEHTSELQSRQYLVCRLLLEKKKIPPNFRSTALVFPT